MQLALIQLLYRSKYRDIGHSPKGTQFVSGGSLESKRLNRHTAPLPGILNLSLPWSAKACVMGSAVSTLSPLILTAGLWHRCYQLTSRTRKGRQAMPTRVPKAIHIMGWSQELREIFQWLQIFSSLPHHSAPKPSCVLFLMSQFWYLTKASLHI